MKRTRILVWILILMLTAATALTGCAPKEPTATTASPGAATSSTGAAVTTTADSSVKFPLPQPVTFNLMVRPVVSIDNYLAKCDFYTRLVKETNVQIKWTYLAADNAMGTLNAIFAAKNEGDAIIGGSTVTESDLSLLAANQLLTPLDKYIDDQKIMPIFNQRVLSESPGTKGFITLPDGKIYSLPKYTALEGNYLESPIWINKTWLTNLGLSVPTTIEDFEKVLVAFKDGDANKNGKADEIPYLFLNGHAFSHMEAMLGMWGIATKDGTLDSFVYIKDGKVNFAPTANAYKAALTMFNRWYKNGLIWSECFTGSNETYNAKLSGATALVGVLTAKTPPTGTYKDEYVLIKPPKVAGYDTVWYRHPGRLGGKGQFSLTRSVKNPEILMHWIDLFYSLENTMEIYNGKAGEGRLEMVNGKYKLITPPTAEATRLNEEKPLFYNFFLNLPAAYTAADYQDKIELSSSQAIFQSSYAVYKDIMTNEYWPRPYYAQADTSRISELRTDIFNTVGLKKAAWLTGTADINAEWDSYVQSLNNMGLKEYLQILQKTYDTFLAGTKK